MIFSLLPTCKKQKRDAAARVLYGGRMVYEVGSIATNQGETDSNLNKVKKDPHTTNRKPTTGYKRTRRALAQAPYYKGNQKPTKKTGVLSQKDADDCRSLKKGSHGEGRGKRG